MSSGVAIPRPDFWPPVLQPRHAPCVQRSALVVLATEVIPGWFGKGTPKMQRESPQEILTHRMRYVFCLNVCYVSCVCYVS